MKRESDYRICFPAERVFISRDHNWAFSAWEIGRMRNYIKPGATVVHIDGHLDSLEPSPSVSTEEITTEDEAIQVGSKLRIYEFIVPAQKNGTVGDVYMISNDKEDLEGQAGMERAYTLNHYKDVYRRKWFDHSEGKSVILDLDLDFFNLNYHDWNSDAVLLPEHLIRTQLENMKKHMWDWDMITVALSPEYCGGEKESKYLLELFLDVFNLDRTKAIDW